jgi:hypothetical protein
VSASRSPEGWGWILDAAYISAISALAGSVIGGLTTDFTTLLSQRSQARAGMIAHDLARREDLVRDFIIAASKTYGDAIGNNEPKMPEIVDLYAMVNRMRVLGMRKTTGCADVVMRSIIDTYFGPKRTLADLRELVRTGQGIDPLKDFSEAAREELARVRVALKEMGRLHSYHLEKSMFSVSRAMLMVVLKAWLTEMKETPCASTSLAKVLARCSISTVAVMPTVRTTLGGVLIPMQTHMG